MSRTRSFISAQYTVDHRDRQSVATAVSAACVPHVLNRCHFYVHAIGRTRVRIPAAHTSQTLSRAPWDATQAGSTLFGVRIGSSEP